MKVTLKRSRGRSITQPSTDEVEAEVRRLGNELEYLTLDMGGENYLQAASGGCHGIPAGVFWVERSEGGPDVHFRCCRRAVPPPELRSETEPGHLNRPSDV